MSRKTIATALAATALALVPAAAGATPTGPAPSGAADGYVAGAGVATDDWGDESTVSRTSFARSNYAAMWQAVLWADGLLAANQIDCSFGPATESATVAWQTRYSLPVTGRADNTTLSYADRWLGIDRVSPDGNGDYVSYLGTDGRRVYFHRNGAGVNYRYDMQNPRTGEWRGVWYRTVNFAGC